MIKTSDRRGGDPVQPMARFLRSWIAEPVVRWHRRNVLYREMMSLDDRTLAEIGMSRFDVPYFVHNVDLDGGPNSHRPMSQRGAGRWRKFDRRLAA